MKSADYPGDSSSDEDQDNINFSNISVEKALELVVAYVSVSVNQSHERRLGAITKYDYVPYICLCRYFNQIWRICSLISQFNDRHGRFSNGLNFS
jgi:hypothetical protein